MGSIKIIFEGTPAELGPIIARFKVMALKRMTEADSMDRARQVWEDFRRFQKDPEFIKAKEDVKERFSKDLFTK